MWQQTNTHLRPSNTLRGDAYSTSNVSREDPPVAIVRGKKWLLLRDCSFPCPLSSRYIPRLVFRRALATALGPIVGAKTEKKSPPSNVVHTEIRKRKDGREFGGPKEYHVIWTKRYRVLETCAVIIPTVSGKNIRKPGNSRQRHVRRCRDREHARGLEFYGNAGPCSTHNSPRCVP